MRKPKVNDGVAPKHPSYLKAKKNQNERPNLLEIKLKDTDSVPQVWYKGEEIKGKKSVEYFWETRDELNFGEQKIEIKHFVKKGKMPDIETIGHERPF